MNRKGPLYSIEYIPLLIRMKCMEEACLPEFLGSTLHGILGWALQSCPKAYGYLFENRRGDRGKRDIVNPYILELPPYRTVYHAQDELCFQIVLLGNSVHYARSIAETLGNIKKYGFGAERRQFALTDIWHGKHFETIWKEGALDEGAIQICVLEDEIHGEFGNCSVLLRTPLRIRRNGALLEEIDFPVLIRNITRRIEALTKRYGGTLNEEEAERVCGVAAEIHIKSSGLDRKEIERFSSRKGEKMDFSGVLGAMTFEGDLSPFVPWLEAASFLHIGRNITFGYGKVDVVFW